MQEKTKLPIGNSVFARIFVLFRSPLGQNLASALPGAASLPSALPGVPTLPSTLAGAFTLPLERGAAGVLATIAFFVVFIELISDFF